MPDIFVPIDTSGYSQKVNKLLIDGNFSGYVYNYYLQHRKEVDSYKTTNDYIQDFNHNGEMWDGLRNYAIKDSVDLSAITEKEKGSLEKRLKAFLARFRWRNAGYYQVLNSDDTAIKKALEEMNNKKATL